jgi:cell division protein FtsX
MGCVLAVLGAFAPRVVLVLLWLFTNLVDRAFDTFLVPLLGFIFLPYTTLLYVLVWRPLVGVTGGGWILVLVGLILDLGSFGGGYRSRRARYYA